jgi:phenylacetate-coenzyme A ligase PaaK-like adenylate-forming protein
MPGAGMACAAPRAGFRDRPQAGVNPRAEITTPIVDSWLWASTFGETLAAGFDPVGVARPQREGRFADLLRVARDSPLYRQRLSSAHVAALSQLQSLQPVDKTELMQRFDEWATDRAVTKAAVDQFLRGTAHLGDAFLGRYLVWTSSGTTGTPGIFVQDARSLAAYEALDSLRLRGPELRTVPLAVWSVGQRFAFVAATGGHFAGTATIERFKRMARDASGSPLGWLAPTVRVFSVQTPLRELTTTLQAFGPTVLITYPSCAAALAQLQLDGTLHLRLNEVWLGGEQLSSGQRKLLQTAFGCPTRNNYGASEFFSIACECAHGRLHVNEDWVILEPVDRRLRPVPAGAASHAVLLTSLANHVQPLLRYRLDDAIRITGEKCPCGCAFPVIEVQGRSGHTLVLHDAHQRPVTILPLAVETVIEECAHVTQFQLLCTAPNVLELRFEPEVIDTVGAFERARTALAEFLAAHGVAAVRIVHGQRAPLRERASGKLCRVRQAPSEHR